MDLTLINPNYETKGRLKLHLEVQRYPPLSLLYLSSYVKKKFSSKIIDAAAEGLSNEQVAELVKTAHPKYIGVYVTSFTLIQVKDLIEKIKKKINPVIILGGPHIIYHPTSVSALGADFGIIGEGEEPLLNLLTCLKEAKSTRRVKRLVLKEGKKIIINKSGKALQNLDSLPFPDRRCLPNEKYFSPLHRGKITTMITSKGCIYDCIFCALPNRKTYRERSPDNVIKEIKEIISQGFDYIEIQDDLFTLSKSRVKKICEQIIKNRMKIDWGCETRADMVDYDLLISMRKAGCTNIKFGVESGSERIRNEVIGKKLKRSAIIKGFCNAKKTGMITVGYFMIGLPTESEEEAKRTIEFALALNPDYAEFHIPVPIPGSRLFEDSMKKSKINKGIWEELLKGGTLPVYGGSKIKADDLIAMRKKAYLRFYLRPGKIIEQIKSIKSIGELILKTKIALTMVTMK
jgi:anaerobic magnesium-protoporphyrin IX monomethyl ester cyclase